MSVLLPGFQTFQKLWINKKTILVVTIRVPIQPLVV